MTFNEKMTAICNAIRSKTGKSEKLSLDEMAAEVNGLIATPSIVRLESNLEKLSDGMFRGNSSLAEVVFTSAVSTAQGAFSNCSNLLNASFPLSERISRDAFNGCKALTTINAPSAKVISIAAFYACQALVSVNFPSATLIDGSSFSECIMLSRAEFSNLQTIAVSAFNNCVRLETLILRGNSVVNLTSLNALSETPIAKGNGYIYVPSSLVDSYKSATNWSVYASQIRAIEDYPEIVGG